MKWFALFLASAPLLAQGVITTFAGAGHTFTDDGQPAQSARLIHPTAVALDGQGDTYIVSSDQNVVVSVTPDGVIHVVAGNGAAAFSGDGGPAVQASLSGPSGIAFDPAGNLYIADTNNQRIRMVTPGGTITTVVGTGIGGFSGDSGPALQANLNAPRSVAVDPSGNLYFIDLFNERVRKVDSTGTISTVVGNGSVGGAGNGGPGIDANMNNPLAICVDNQGNLYIADQFSNQIRVLTPDGNINGVAGNGNFSYSGDLGPAVSAGIQEPGGVAVDGQGNLYIADTGNQRIRRVDANGIITTVAGNGQIGYSGDGGPAAAATVAGPLGLAVDSGGNVYVADSENGAVREFASGGTIGTFAGDGLVVGDSAPAVSALLSAPSAVAIDANGDVFIADSGQNRIREVTPDGTITTAAGSGYAGPSVDASPPTAGYLSTPQGVAVGPDGRIYITDGNKIRVFTPGGTLMTVAGTGGCCYAGDGGPATAALLLTPGSVVLDSAGDIYFSSLVRTPAGVGLSPVVRVVTPDGIINTVGGNGTLAPGFSGDGGPANQASFGPGIAVGLNASGNLLIADTFNNRVRRVDGNGIITTIAGNGSSVTSGDGGSATAAGLPSPYGLVADLLGNIYVSSFLGTIRKIGPDGAISTYAGGRYGFSGDGGPATAAALAGPHGLAIDAAGNLYIADYTNNRVRVVSPQ